MRRIQQFFSESALSPPASRQPLLTKPVRFPHYPDDDCRTERELVGFDWRLLAVFPNH